MNDVRYRDVTMYGPVVDDEITCVIPNNAPSLVDKIEILSYSLTRTEMNVHEGNRFLDFQWGSSKRPSFGVVSGSIAYDDCNLPRFERGKPPQGMTITSTPSFPYDVQMRVSQGVYTVDVGLGTATHDDVTAVTTIVDEPYAYPYVISFYMKPDVIRIRDAFANAMVTWTRADKTPPSILDVEPVAGKKYTLSINWLDLTQILSTEHVIEFKMSVVQTTNGVITSIAWPTERESDPVVYDASSKYSASAVVTMDTGETLRVSNIHTLRSATVSVAPWAQTETQPAALNATMLAAATTKRQLAQKTTDAETQITRATEKVNTATAGARTANETLTKATEAATQATEALSAATISREAAQVAVAAGEVEVQSVTADAATSAASQAAAVTAAQRELTTASENATTKQKALDDAGEADKLAKTELAQYLLEAIQKAEAAEAAKAAAQAAQAAADIAASTTLPDEDRLAANEEAAKLAAALVAAATELGRIARAKADAATALVAACNTANETAKATKATAQTAYDGAVAAQKKGATTYAAQLAKAEKDLAVARTAYDQAVATEATCTNESNTTAATSVNATAAYDTAVRATEKAKLDLAAAQANQVSEARGEADAIASTIQAAGAWKNATELLHHAATTGTDRLSTVPVTTLTTEDGAWSYSTIRIKNMSPAYLNLVTRIGVSETPITNAHPTKYADMAYQAEARRGLDYGPCQLAYNYVMAVPPEYREAAYAERGWARDAISNDTPAYYTLDPISGVTCAMSKGSISVDVTDSFTEAPSGLFDARTLTAQFVAKCPTIAFQPDLVGILSGTHSTTTTPTAFRNAVGAAYDKSHRNKSESSLPSFWPHEEGGGTFSAPRAFAVLHVDRLTNVLHASASYELTDTANNAFIESRYDATERVYTATIGGRGRTQYNASVFATWSRYHAKTRDRRFVLQPVIANTLVAELRPGTYTAAQLAEEVEVSMNKALGSLDDTTRGKQEITIRVSLNEDAMPLTIQEAFELAQLKLYRAPIPTSHLYIRIATTETYTTTAGVNVKCEMPTERPDKKTEVRLLFQTGANAHRSAHRLLGFQRSDHCKWDWLVADSRSLVTTAEAALQAPYPYDLCDDPKMLRVTMRVNDAEAKPMYHETHAHDEGTFLLYIGSLPSVLDVPRLHGVPLLRMSDYGAKVVQQQQTKQTIDRISLRFDVSYPVSASDTFTTRYNFRNQNVLFVFRLWEVVLSEKHQDSFNRSHYLTDR
jgi:hypothetical protein